MKAYCVKCKKKVDVKDPRIEDSESSRGIRKFGKGFCVECGGKVCAILKKDGSQN